MKSTAVRLYGKQDLKRGQLKAVQPQILLSIKP